MNDAMRIALEKFADPLNYYFGNECGDAMYQGNAIKEAQAALKNECYLCDEALGDANDHTGNFHIVCAEREQARVEAKWLAMSKMDFPF